MSDRQTPGRTENGAVPAGKPDPSTPEKDVEQTGRRERRSAGPDGPDAAEVGDTFKSPPN